MKDLNFILGLSNWGDDAVGKPVRPPQRRAQPRRIQIKIYDAGMTIR